MDKPGIVSPFPTFNSPHRYTRDSMVVRTASEFKRLVRERDFKSVESTDAITCATMSLMDTVSADFSINVPNHIPSGYVDYVKLNGLSVTPDMVRDGHLDCMILGESVRQDGYGTGHLYRDIASGKKIEVELVMDDIPYRTSVTIDDIPKAMMTVTYDTVTSIGAFINDKSTDKPALYSGPNGLPKNGEGCSIIGCGEIEPLFNHRGGSALNVGDRVLLNGAIGKIIRASTEDDDENRFIQIMADIHDMDPRYMGGFTTPYGPMCVISVATMIRVDHDDITRELVVSDMGVPLPIVFRDNIVPKYWDSYGSVWPPSTRISVDRSRCLDCDECSADRLCPMGARPSAGPNMDLCLSCGSCISNCRGNVFSGNMGHITVDGKITPVRIRLSSREKAEELCELLKTRISNGDITL